MTDIDFTIIEETNGSIFSQPTIKVKPILSVGYNPIHDVFDSVRCVCPICNAAKRSVELSMNYSGIAQCPRCGVNLDWTEYKKKCKKLGI